MNHQAYTSKNKEIGNSKNMIQKVNGGVISSNKTKSSSSYAYKQQQSNNPVLLKLIDRSKIKGYI